MLPRTNGGAYYGPQESNQVKKSLVDERLERARIQLDLLKRAPAGIDDETFNQFLAQAVDSLAADLRQILNS